MAGRKFYLLKHKLVYYILFKAHYILLFLTGFSSQLTISLNSLWQGNNASCYNFQEILKFSDGVPGAWLVEVLRDAN